jgi:hypothetical protein
MPLSGNSHFPNHEGYMIPSEVSKVMLKSEIIISLISRLPLKSKFHDQGTMNHLKLLTIGQDFLGYLTDIVDYLENRIILAYL